MAAYRADIEIGVRGSSRLKELQDRITRLSRSIEDVNVKTLIDRKAVQSIESYTQALGRASSNLREVKIQLDAAGKASGDYAQAINQYVTALGQSNAAQKLQNELISDEIELRRKQKLAASGIRESTQYGGPIGPGPASAVGTLAGQTSPVGERIRRLIQGRQEELELQQALLRLEQKSATELNKKVQAQENLVRGTQEVVDLIEQANRKSRFLAGTSGGGIQGPLAGPGAMGFPIALPLTKAEQAGLEIAAKKEQILQRMASTRRQLAGLAQNLQRLDQNSAVAIADAHRFQQQLNNAKRESVVLSERELNISKQGALLAGRFSPVGGAENIPGSPAFLAARRRLRGQQAQGVALGAGFPLLFGGGPGAVLGGAAGGLVGGPAGFAAQIALSAIGQQFDKLGEQAVKVGQALNPLTFDLTTFAGAAGIAGTETADFLAKIEQFGGKAAAAKEAAKLLARRIGTDATQALQKFGEDAQKVGNQISLIFTTVLANIARIAGPLLAGLASNLERSNLIAGFRQREGLTGRQAVAQQILGITGRGAKGKAGSAAQIRALGGQIGLTGTTAQIREQAKNIAAESQKAFEASADKALALRATQLEAESKTTKGAKSTKGDEERVARALISQRAITLEVQRQSEFSAKIAAAELAKDPVLARRLRGEQALAELGVETAKQLELEKNTSVQLAISKTAQAKADLIRQKTAQDIAKIEQDRKEKFADVLADLQYQVEYESAVTREKRNQLELDNEARKLNKDGFSPEQTATLVGLKKRLQQQQEPLAKFIKDSQRQLKDLEQVAVNVSQGIGNAIANSMSQGIQGLIEGTKTAQQVFADFLKGVGDVLIQEGTRMIAMYIAIGIAKAFAGMGGGGKQDAPDIQGFSAYKISDQPLTLNDFPKYAEGGFVTGPTNALIGEGGEPEYVIPASKMRGAMNRYAAGARGSSVIPSGGEQGTGEGGTAVATPIDVRYTVERINSVDYVTADQFQAGMQQAAQQGAAQGEQRTLRRLQMSTSTRKRLGM